MIVIGDVLHEPWRSISVDGQMRTWLVDAQDNPRIRVRHSHARRLGSIGRWFDRAHEQARWSTHGRRWIPLIDNIVGRPWRGWRPRVTVGTWAGSDQMSWAQSMPDMYALQRWKVVTSLTQALAEPGWDYVYFTTASSYVRVGALLERVDALPPSGVLAGTRMVEGTTLEVFASGANRIFSRDVAELVVRHRRAYSNDVMEDVGVSRLVAAHGVSVVSWPSVNLASRSDLEATPDQVLLHNHHFRLRSEEAGMRTDVALMHVLHDRLRNLETA